MFASNLSHRDRKPNIYKQILNKTWRWWQAMAPHPIPLSCALAFPPPRHQDATTPSPCWAPHLMTQGRIMFSNPTPSKPLLSPAATMSDDTLSALRGSLRLALRLYLAACNPSSSCHFWVLDHLCSNSSPSFHLWLNNGNPIFEPVCVFLPFSLLPLIFW